LLVPHARAFHWLDPRTAHQRLLWGIAIGIVAWLVSPSTLSPVTRGLIGGDVGGLALLAIALWIVARADSEETRRRAAAYDPGRTFVWVIVVGVSAISLFAATFVQRHAQSLPSGEGVLLTGLTVATAAISWLLTHTGFTLRYAHLYYRGGKSNEGGINFPTDDKSKDKPDDLDFAYFAFTIGMCFQVSDAAITDRKIRHTALVHALVSFIYNTGILALVLNIVMTRLG
jgi:uncharacterized membrane protein